MRISHVPKETPTTEPKAVEKKASWPGHEKFTDWLTANGGEYVSLKAGLDNNGLDAEYRAALPTLPHSGFILHNAITVPFWAELKLAHPGRFIELHHDGGLGIIAPKGGAIPEKIEELFKMDYVQSIIFRAKLNNFIDNKPTN